MLTIQRFHSEWSLDALFDDDQWCPICLGHEFLYTEGDEGVFCKTCEARFVVRPTAGDPGVVIDCWADPTGRYAALPGQKGVLPQDNLYYFWQVLKTCEDGLGDRVRWCSHAARYSFYYTLANAQAGPIFAQVYQFYPLHVVEAQTWDLWLASPEKADFDRQKEGMQENNSEWMEIYYKEQASRFAFDDAHKHALRAKLPGCPQGLYFRSQCDAVYQTSALWLKPCVPKAGEKPLVKHPFYVRKETD